MWRYAADKQVVGFRNAPVCEFSPSVSGRRASSAERVSKTERLHPAATVDHCLTLFTEGLVVCLYGGGAPDPLPVCGLYPRVIFIPGPLRDADACACSDAWLCLTPSWADHYVDCPMASFAHRLGYFRIADRLRSELVPLLCADQAHIQEQ